METSLSHQQKIERLETEKRQLENRIRQLKHAAHTAERKRLTRAKIILGSLVLRNHAELLRQLITRGFSAGWRTSAVGLSQCNEGRLTFIGSVSVGGDFGKDIAKLPEPFNKGEAHLRVAGVSPRCPCVSAICGKGSLPLARHPIFFPKSRKASLVIWRSFISRSGRSAWAKGHGAVAQIAYDTRCKLTDDRTGQKHDWSKHKQDVIQWQIIGPKMTPGELAARAEQAERRWDARVGRAMDVALPHELNPKAQWDLLRGFGLQLRDEYGAALCVSLHHPNTKGDQRNAHGHIFMTSRVVDEDGDFSKTKIRSLDDRKLGPVEVERIREMWEVRCNRALRKAGLSGEVTRHSLKAQGIDRPATQHLGPKAVAMTRNGCRPRKAETNGEIFSAFRRMAEIESHLQHLKTHAHRVSHKQSARPQIRADAKSNLAATSEPHRSTFKRKTYGLAVRGKSRLTYHGHRPAGNHPRPWLAHPNPARELADFKLPEELQSDELLRAITSGEVNCLSGSCEPFEQLLGSSKASDRDEESR